MNSPRDNFSLQLKCIGIPIKSNVTLNTDEISFSFFAADHCADSNLCGAQLWQCKKRFERTDCFSFDRFFSNWCSLYFKSFDVLQCFQLLMHGIPEEENSCFLFFHVCFIGFWSQMDLMTALPVDWESSPTKHKLLEVDEANIEMDNQHLMEVVEVHECNGFCLRPNKAKGVNRCQLLFQPHPIVSPFLQKAT